MLELLASVVTAVSLLLPQAIVPASDPAQVGIRASAYEGRYVDANYERYRRCVIKRESGGIYHIASPSGKYRGAYQVSPELAVGMGWMIQKELRLQGVERADAIRIGRELRAHPIDEWGRYWQDMGFWLVLDHGKGRGHWDTGARYGC